MDENKELVLIRIDDNRRIIKGDSENEYIIITRNNRYTVALIDKKLFINGNLIEVPEENYYSRFSFDYEMKLDGLMFCFLGRSDMLDIFFNGERVMKNYYHYELKERIKRKKEKLIDIEIMEITPNEFIIKGKSESHKIVFLDKQDDKYRYFLFDGEEIRVRCYYAFGFVGKGFDYIFTIDERKVRFIRKEIRGTRITINDFVLDGKSYYQTNTFYRPVWLTYVNYAYIYAIVIYLYVIGYMFPKSDFLLKNALIVSPALLLDDIFAKCVYYIVNKFTRF